MKALWIFLVSAVLLQAQKSGLDQGKPYLDKAVAALGGNAFLGMRNRVEKGRVYSFFHEQISGLGIGTIYTEYIDDPSADGLRVRQRQSFGKKKEEYADLFLSNQAWEITFRGARPLPDESWQRYLLATENNIFYFLRSRYSESGLQFDYVGRDVVLGKEVDGVEITDTKKRSIRVYLDRETSLPVRQSYKWTDPDTKYRNEEVTDFSKYRDVGGVRWPLATHRERNGFKVFEVFADQIEINQTLPPKIFDLPPNARMLKRID